MSATTNGDVTHIKDEDVLKRMWQETEDFGKKKEIRAHMYKLREARLRDLYTNSDVISSTEKSCTQSTHADNLADHSFMSLKNKEIRDSESPTRDISYRISTGVPVDAKWNINKVEERTHDGKGYTSTQSAECAGTELIPKGKLDFEAKNQQSSSVYEDGDENNYVRKAGSSSNTFVKQEAVGGDENSSFRSSSMKTSSSSRTVTEQKSSYNDYTDNVKSIPCNSDQIVNTITKTYTTDVPDDLKKHPGFVDGKTKVTRETKTLADGTVVTTTKYETTGVNTAVKSSQESYSTSKYEERSSRTTSSNSLYDKKDYKDKKTIIEPKDQYIESIPTKNNKEKSANVKDYKTSNVTKDYSQKTVKESDISKESIIKDSHFINRSVDDETRSKTSTYTNKAENVKNRKISNEENIKSSATCDVSNVVKSHTDSKKTYDISSNVDLQSQTDFKKTHDVYSNVDLKSQTDIKKTYDISSNIDLQSKTDIKKTHDVYSNVDLKSQTDTKKTYNVSRDVDSRSQTDIKITQDVELNAKKPVNEKKFPKEASPSQPIEKRESIKPIDNNLDSHPKPTDGQYDTTYRSDYTTKRISVDISPTHNAFASSLRASSPEKISPTRGSTKNLRLSPEKTVYRDYRTSPERKPSRKSPEKFSSTETITYKSPRSSPEKSSPERSYSTKRQNEEFHRTASSETITKRKQSTDTIRKSYKKDTSLRDLNVVTTDLDEQVTVNKVRPSSLDITSKVNEINIEKETKTKPPLRRTDTYEERCRQILGITNETEKRKNSLDRKSRGSITDTYASPKTSPTKENKPIQEFPSQIRRSPERRDSIQSRKSPEKKSSFKAGSPTKDRKSVQEFPAQIRRSPKKSPGNDVPKRKSPEKQPDNRSPRKNSKPIQEFPSQIRRSPEKVIKSHDSPERKIFTDCIKTTKRNDSVDLDSTDDIAKIIKEFTYKEKKSSQVDDFPKCDWPKRPKDKSPQQKEKSPERSYPKEYEPRSYTLTNTEQKTTIQEFPSQRRKSTEKPDVITKTSTTQKRKSSDDKTVHKEEITISITDTIQDNSSVNKIDENKDNIITETTETYVLKAIPNDNSEYSNQNRRDTYEAIYVVNDIQDETNELNKTETEEYILKKNAVNKTEQSRNLSLENLKPSLKEQSKPSDKKKPQTKPTKMENYPKKSLDTNKKTKISIEQLNVTNKNIDETNEVIQKDNYDLQYVGKTPVVEPLIIKKQAYKLCDDDEDVIKKLIDSEQNIQNVTKIATKKNTKDVTTDFITDQRRKSTTNKTIVKNKSTDKINGQPEKKPLTDKNRYKPKISGETEYTDKYGKPTNKIPTTKKETPRQNTLSDIENFENIKEDTSIHKRTNRVDETVSKKKVTNTTNKHTTPVTKTPSKTSVPIKRTSLNVVPTKKPEPKIYTFSSSTRTNPVGIPKLHTPKKPAPKSTPSTKDKRRPSQGKVPTNKTNKNKIKVTDSESDTESIADSLEGSVAKKTKTVTEKIKEDNIRYTKKAPTPKLEKKSISSKSILVNADTDKQVIVDLIRSTSSREPTPDRVCPLPISLDDDFSTPRYPDQVTEPDEDIRVPRKTPKLIDTAIIENEVTEVQKIVEILDDTTNKITEIDKVDENDDSLLSVNKKITKFISTAEKLTPKPIVDISQPAPKVERPNFEVDETLKEDVCILSVSDKVKKFKTKSDNVQQSNQNKATQETTRSNVFEKVNKFTSSVEEKSKPTRIIDELEDSKTTKVSETVKKFSSDTQLEDSSKNINIASLQPSNIQPQTDKNTPEDFITIECKQIDNEGDVYRLKNKPTEKTIDKKSYPKKLESEQKTTVTISSIGVKTTEPKKSYPIVDDYATPKSTTKTNKSDFITTECMQIEKDEDLYRTTRPIITTKSVKRTSIDKIEDKRTSPVRKPSIDKTLERKDSYQGASPSKVKQTNEFTPKTARRSSQEEKVILSSAGRLRSTESIKRAKALFENNDSKKDVPSKKTTLEMKKVKEINRSVDRANVTPKRLDFDSSPNKEPKTNLHRKSPEKSTFERKPSKPTIVKESTQTVVTITNEQNEQIEDIPSYMKPLDRSLRLNSPNRESVAATSPEVLQSPGKPTKFGVTLRRTDSGRAFTTPTYQPTTTKKHPILSKAMVTEEEIEEIFELEILEELLLKITGYELRRKVRLQIKLVKQLIVENRLEIYIQELIRRRKLSSSNKITTSNRRKESDVSVSSGPKSRSPSPLKDTKSTSSTKTYTFTRKESTSSSKQSDVRSRSTSPTKDKPKKDTSRPFTSARKPSPEKNIKSSYTVTENSYSRKESSSTRSRSSSPEKEVKTKPMKKHFQTTLKKTEKTKSETFNGQPEWVTNRNLRKVDDKVKTREQELKKTNSWSSTKERSEKKSNKELKTVDVITSSYGVGPTDEHGSPLFGLKALRAQNNTGTSKVQGTVVTSHYYSESGKEPVGQVSVTKYSTDPKDLTGEGNVTQEGDIMSVTTTQKFGYNDTPSLKQLKDNENTRTDRKSTTKSVTRRNSVKELKQKFVENRESHKTERKDSYPKAGLILRSSSFKANSPTEDKEEFFHEEKAEASMYVKTSSSTVSGDTFLTNKSRVTGVRDVIQRMKAEDVTEGESEEDREAKSLLNKFLGSQVILSGLEGSLTKTTARVQSAAVKRTTKVTLTTTENGKESTKTLIFEHPITEEVLETLWDEEIVKYLLEQSEDYEERKRLRGRLRVIMSEQAACTELVKQSSQEQSGGTLEEKTESSEKIVTEGPVTTKITTRVSSQQQVSKKPMSPFAKFRQLDKQNSLNTPPGTPKTPLSAGSGVLFKFTDESLSQSASTIKERLLNWCRMKTKGYENIQLDNFSTSWADGLAFCALIHHFIPDAFDYHVLTPKERRHNFTLAFKVADEKADIAPLLDVDDMVETRRPDWKCVFTYVQSIHRHFKDVD